MAARGLSVSPAGPGPAQPQPRYGPRRPPATPPDPARPPARSMPRVRRLRGNWGKCWRRRPGSGEWGRGNPGCCLACSEGIPCSGGASLVCSLLRPLQVVWRVFCAAEDSFGGFWGCRRLRRWFGVGLVVQEAPSGLKGSFGGEFGGSRGVVWVEGLVLGIFPVVDETPGLGGLFGGALGALRAPCVPGGGLKTARPLWGPSCALEVPCACGGSLGPAGDSDPDLQLWGSLIPAGLVLGGSSLTCGMWGAQCPSPDLCGSPSPPCTRFWGDVQQGRAFPVGLKQCGDRL